MENGDTKRTNGSRGPTWAWIVGVLITIVGAGVGAWMAVVWSQIAQANQELSNLNVNVTELKTEYQAQTATISQQSAELSKLWEKMSQDEQAMLADHYKLGVDDDWVAAHVHADNAIRELHRR